MDEYVLRPPQSFVGIIHARCCTPLHETGCLPQPRACNGGVCNDGQRTTSLRAKSPRRNRFVPVPAPRLADYTSRVRITNQSRVAAVAAAYPPCVARSFQRLQAPLGGKSRSGCWSQNLQIVFHVINEGTEYDDGRDSLLNKDRRNANLHARCLC
jgi:hypothetical protein